MVRKKIKSLASIFHLPARVLDQRTLSFSFDFSLVCNIVGSENKTSIFDIDTSLARKSVGPKNFEFLASIFHLLAI